MTRVTQLTLHMRDKVHGDQHTGIRNIDEKRYS